MGPGRQPGTQFRDQGHAGTTDTMPKSADQSLSIREIAVRYWAAFTRRAAKQTVMLLVFLLPTFALAVVIITLLPGVSSTYIGYLLLAFGGLASMTATATVGDFKRVKQRNEGHQNGAISERPLILWSVMTSVAFSAVILIGATGGYSIEVVGGNPIIGITIAVFIPYLNYFLGNVSSRLSVSYVVSGIVIRLYEGVGVNSEKTEALRRDLSSTLDQSYTT